MQIYFHCRTIFHLLLLFIDRNGNYIFSFSCDCCALHTAHWLSTFWHIIFFSFLCWFWFCLVSGGFSCIDWMCRFAFPLVSSSTSWICNDFFFCIAESIVWPAIFLGRWQTFYFLKSIRFVAKVNEDCAYAFDYYYLHDSCVREGQMIITIKQNKEYAFSRCWLEYLDSSLRNAELDQCEANKKINRFTVVRCGKDYKTISPA